MKAKLLIVEDETSLRASLQEYFEREGFDVTTAEDGARALAALNQVNPDLIILDVQLPHLDGLEVCRTVRQRVGSAVGIVMISGIKKETLDRVVGLELGADVYLTKPFETRELLAQVRALLRRIQAQQARGDAAGWFVVDDYLRIHFDRRLVERGGREVHLTRLEFELLKYLAQRPGAACARADLLDAVWEYDEAGLDVSDAAVNTCVAKLRAKIEPDPGNPRYIQSVHGVGYRFKVSTNVNE
ncbi:MAG: response regulator transcription factor [Chloroflexi bacterium]|nr:response regulator transcription factor [Chloroflexota bacterium]